MKNHFPRCVIILIAAVTMNFSEINSYDIPTPGLNAKDLQFLVDASYSNLDEVEMGSLAATKGAGKGVRMLGHMMAEDHGTAQAELKAVADTVRTAVPESADSVHILIKQSLANLSGAAFDSTYLHALVTDHRTAIGLFQSELHSGKDINVKDYARKHLPKIRMHLAMADSLLRTMQQ
ncbi:MAG TPA: DUF4142 domain-containing protein [Puia sp.]|jgi:putative membrane protein|nr:DUF4142 domain-containing protein [Puia sp.]